MPKGEEQRALDIHRKSIVINGLEVGFFYQKFLPRYLEELSAYFKKLIDAGITAGNHTVCDPPQADFNEFLRGVYDSYTWIENNADRATLITSVDDIEMAKKDKKFGLILGTQSAKFLGDDLTKLGIARKLGLMIIQLTYQRRNYVGDGCGERTDSGLSKFGIKLIEEMDKLGIVIDLSHVGKTTTMDAMEVSKNPVIFSHSSAKALLNHGRNIDDEQIKTVAEKKGVVGICSWSPLLVRPPYTDNPKLETLLDHIDYVVKLVGVDHVGFGLDIPEGWIKEDFEATKKLFPEVYPTRFEEWPMEGLESTTKMLNLTMGLVARGYSDQDIGRMLGGNFIRVFKDVWRKI